MLVRICLLAIASIMFLAGCSGGSSPETVNEAPKASTPKVEPAKPEETAATGGGIASNVKFAEVQAILTTSCVACHKGEAAKEKLDMSSYDLLMKGSEHGPVVLAGDSDNSLIIKALKGSGAKQMPMMADPLPADEIAKVEAWIKAGAKNE